MKFIHNTVASAVNTPINVINTLADEAQFIYGSGIGAYFSSGIQSIGNDIGSQLSYWETTPISQQASDTWQAMKEPQNWENAIATAALAITPMKGGAASAKGTISTMSKATGVMEVESVVENAIKVHGNSLKSQRPTWEYKLYSTDGTFLKNGITSQRVPEKRYTQRFMEDKKMIPIKQFLKRKTAWEWEYQQNLIERGPLNKNMH